MSISLPNGTILAAPSSTQPQISAAVTRILHLSNFSAELKTRDLQLIFKDWENEKGGFRIKWLDDVNALVVFADASVAKRAYLSLLANPPPTFSPPATIRPYDRPDAAQIIQSLAARSMGHRASMSNAMIGGSISAFPFPSNNDPAAPQVHSRAMSVTNSIGKSHSGSISGIAGLPSSSHARGVTAPQRIGGGGSISIPGSSSGFHQRNGSASSSWGRPSASGGAGAAFGALSFGNAPRARLPTHSESSVPSRSASSSSGGDPVLLVDNSAGWKGGAGSGANARRESVSAEKALQNVQKALASVEAQG